MTHATIDASRIARLDEALAREVEAGRIPAAVVLVLSGDAIVHESVTGYRDAATNASMRRDDLFRLASMTKPLVSVAALLLAEEGRLVLSEPVATYVPAFGAVVVGDARDQPERPPTVQDLFRHTSGLTYGPFGTSPIENAYREAGVLSQQQSGDDFVRKLAAIPLQYQPGTTFEYSVSTDLLGRIVEIVAGQPLGAFLSQRLFEPLGMTDTAFALDDARAARLAEGLANTSGAPLLASLYTHARPPVWQSGGGGLLGSAPDYARFAAMLLAGGSSEGRTYLGRKTFELMTRNHLPPGVAYGPFTAQLGVAAPLPANGYGFGLGVGVRVDAGRNVSPGSIGDFGWGGISGTLFWCDPQERLAVVALLAAPDQRARMRPIVRSLVYQALR